MKAETPKDVVADLMKHSLVELPFGDFDQRMMMEIRREAVVLAKSKKDKDRSALFFTLGCLLGAIFSNWLVFTGGDSIQGGRLMLMAVGVLMFLLFVKSAYAMLVKSTIDNG